MLKKNGAKFSNGEFSLEADDIVAAGLAEESGVLKKLRNGIQDHPFGKEIACFSTALKFRVSDNDDVEFSLKTLAKFADSIPANQRDLLKPTIDRYRNAAKKYPQCVKTVGVVSQIEEAMPDMIAAAVTEKFLMDNPFRSEEEKVASFFFARETCSNFIAAPISSPVAVPLTPSIPPYKIDQVFGSLMTRIAHPDVSIRTEKIMLNLPGMAKLLDCKRTVPACIDHLSFANRPAAKKDGTANTQGAIK